MHIEQRRVTAISLHDGRVRDISLHSDGRGYRLSLVSKDEVVNLHLSGDDLQKLRHELGRPFMQNGRKEFQSNGEMHHHVKDHAPIYDRTYSTIVSAEPFAFPWNNVDWLAFN